MLRTITLLLLLPMALATWAPVIVVLGVILGAW